MRNYKTELIVAVICASFILFGYIAWKAKNQEVKRLQTELKERDTPTVCQDDDAKDVHCFFYQKLDDAEALGAKRTVDEFRDCKRIYTQHEDESLKHFYKRNHVTDGGCIIFRGTPQAEEAGYLPFPRHVQGIVKLFGPYGQASTIYGENCWFHKNGPEGVALSCDKLYPLGEICSEGRGEKVRQSIYSLICVSMLALLTLIAKQHPLVLVSVAYIIGAYRWELFERGKP